MMELAMTIRQSGCILVVLLASLELRTADAEDWPQFRGPRGRGVSSETGIPVAWGRGENVKWRAALPEPGNNGSPIVSRGAVFIAVAEEGGRKRSLHCYDRETGKERWVRSVLFEGKELTHRDNQYAGSTPAADGSRIVVWHSSAGMHCYDYQGQQLWSRDLGEYVHIWGYGGSPVIHGDLVLINCGPGERQRLVALDKKNGQIVWESAEPGGTSGQKKPWLGSWSTPTVAVVDGREQVLVSYPHHVRAFDPKEGTALWQCEGLGNLVYTSVICSGDYGVAMGGYSGPAMAFRLGGEGNVTTQNRLWHVKRNPQRIGSGVILDGDIFMANENASVECFDVKTGKHHWQARLPTKSRIWSSLIAADGHLYVTTQAGETIVFRANRKMYEFVSNNKLAGTTNSTIAVSAGHVFHRTYDALYCIGP
jgi:outer membrane protein assembly factor BamB